MAGIPKSRPPSLQLAAAATLVLMCLVIVYMYRVIDDLHHEQQVMRMQLAELAGSAAAHMPGTIHPALRPSPRRQAEPVPLSEAGVAPPGPLSYLSEDTSVTPDPRKLMAMFSTGTAAGVGCFEIADLASTSHDVSSTTACNGNYCPDCFVTPAVLTQNVALTIQACSSAKWVRGQSRTGVWIYTFINTNSAQSLSVTDNSGSPTVYNVPPSSFVQAYCASTLGTTNKLYFPSMQLPTLTVDSGITMSAGDFNAASSTGTFATGTGAVSLNGDTSVTSSKTFATGTGAASLNGPTTVADSTAFTVGSSGNGGTTTLYGDVVIGSATNTHSVSATLYGSFQQNDDGDSTSKTFKTATGGVYLNGHTTVAINKNLHMTATGTGTFRTGQGTVTLNGATTISSTNTFATGTGAVSLNGDTAVAAAKTLTVGTSGSGGATTLHGDLVVGSSTNGHSVATTIHGSFQQNDDGDSTPKAFTTASGTNTLRGHTTVANNKNLHMTAAGSGTFQSGTGVVTLNGNTVISGSKTFTSGTGQVSLAGAVQIADNTPLSVGSEGSGGNTQLFGNVYIGGATAGTSTLLDVYGNVRFLNDVSGTTKTFSTGTGAISLNGDVTVAANRDLIMQDTGTGSFATGTGPISLNGDTTVKNTKKFTIASYTNQIVCTNDNSGSVGNTYCMASR